MHDIFISYASPDLGIAKATCEALESAGIACWMAPRDIQAGEDWSAAIPRAIDASRTMALMFSEHANASEQVVREVHLAAGRRAKPIVPFRIDGAHPTGALRYLLAGLHWVDARTEAGDAAIALFVRQIEERLREQDAAAIIDAESSVPNNLPQEITTFYGRDREQASLEQLLAQERLITIVGPGGVGKSRLALRASHELLRRDPLAVPDGVWFIELAAVTDPGLVATVIAGTFGIAQNDDPINAICSWLSSRRALVILDNCEHVASACAKVAAQVLRCASRTPILATSRGPLHIRGERVMRLEPLPVPTASALGVPTLENLKTFPAAQLLLNRVETAGFTYVQDEAERKAIGIICRRLDGLPLALELAAARAGTFSFQQIAMHIDQRFRLLKTSDSTAHARQQTLQALIDWSYSVLPEAEQRLFRRLGIFSGSMTLDAICGVARDMVDDEFAVLEQLEALLDKSLVTSAATVAGERRFVMLESIRQFAIDQLRICNEEDIAQENRAAFWVDRSALVEATFQDSYRRWVDRLNADIDDLRSVVEHLLAIGEASTVVTILYATIRFWHDTGRFSEAYQWCIAAVDAPALAGHAFIRGRGLLIAGMMATFLDQYKVGAALLQEALTLLEQTDDKKGVLRCLNCLGIAAQYTGRTEDSLDMFRRCVEQNRVLGDKRGEMVASYNLGLNLLTMAGRFEEASERLQESLRLARELDDNLMVAYALFNLADLADYNGDPQAALELATESLLRAEALGNDPFVSEAKARLAWFHLELGETVPAKRRLIEAIPSLVERGNDAEFASAVVFLAMLCLQEQELELGAQLFRFADELRGRSERTMSLFEGRWHTAAKRALEVSPQNKSATPRAKIRTPEDVVAALLQTAIT